MLSERLIQKLKSLTLIYLRHDVAASLLLACAENVVQPNHTSIHPYIVCYF